MEKLFSHSGQPQRIKYGIMTKELVIGEIRIDEATGQGDSDSLMTRFEVIMSIKLQSNMKTYCKTRSISQLVIRENEWSVWTKEKWQVGV